MITNMQDLSEVVSQIIEDWQTGESGFTTDDMARLNRYIFAHALPKVPDEFGNNPPGKSYIVIPRHVSQRHLKSTNDFKSMSYFKVGENVHGTLWLIDPISLEPVDLLDHQQEHQILLRLSPTNDIMLGFIELRIQQAKSILLAKNLPDGDCPDESHIQV